MVRKSSPSLTSVSGSGGATSLSEQSYPRSGSLVIALPEQDKDVVNSDTPFSFFYLFGDLDDIFLIID